jgi:predicted O-methyltransferase YrrM
MRETPDDRTKYLQSLTPKDSPVALKAKLEAEKLNKDAISISSFEAHLIGFFIRQYHCTTFVEFGTLTGYSGLKILESLPLNGHLWTLELNPECANIAKGLFDEAGFNGRYTILIGRAEDHLEHLLTLAPFDGVFIDANKSAYPSYLNWSLSAIKLGGVIIADNTLLKGVVPHQDQESKPSKIIQNLRQFNERLTNQDLFDSILIPTQEGLTVAIKK